jgi:hypothetical protein
MEFGPGPRPAGSVTVELVDAEGVTHAFRAEVVRCGRTPAGWEADCRFVKVPPAEVLWLLG